MVSAFAYAEAKFSVSGEVAFPKRNGEIHVKLNTQEEYEKGMQVPEDRGLIIKISAQKLKSKKASFEFVNVPEGDYSITCFQGLNENRKLDYSWRTRFMYLRSHGAPITPRISIKLGYF